MAYKVIRHLYLFCLIFLLSCKPGNSDEQQKEDDKSFELPEHFQYERVNEELVYAYHREGAFTNAEGYLRNGKKQGYWFSFFNKRNKIERIEHFVEGQLNGPVREYSLNGRMTLEAFYQDGKLDGPHSIYKFGELLEQSYYADGQLEGEKRIYFDENSLRGVLQEKISYENGVKHGKHLYYNDKGEVVLEYTYKDGVRVEEGKE